MGDNPDGAATLDSDRAAATPSEPPMYIVAIAWIYVVLLMSFTEASIVAGVATFFFYGIAPLTILLYLMGTPQRRRNRRQREALARQAPEQGVVHPDAAESGDDVIRREESPSDDSRR